MPQGLQIFDAAGLVGFDTTDRVCRVLGTITNTNDGNGSQVVPEFSQGTPWYIAMPALNSFYYGSDYMPPNITISGTTISWAKRSNDPYFGSNQSFSYIIYGVY